MRNEFRGLPALVDRWLKKRGIGRDCTVIVGVSGGRDSMALLACLQRIGQPTLAAHVNYGLRGAESEGDQALVEAWCQQSSIPVVVHASPVMDTVDGVQSAARNVRYQWFQKLRLNQEGRALIATAHHADDQAETVLLHLIRSADPLALAAMKPWVASQGLLRPFLEVSRSMITEWVKEERIPFRDDSSNAQPDYLRNRLRNEVLPLLEDLRAGTTAHIGRWAERWQPLAEHLQNDLVEGVRRCYHSEGQDAGTLDIACWKIEPLAEEILFHLAQSWHIGARAVPEVLDLCGPDVQSGARFESTQTVILRKGNQLSWTVRKLATPKT